MEEDKIEDQGHDIDITQLSKDDIMAMDEDTALNVAKKMGYKDPEDWKGDRSKLVDPRTFINTGLNVLPVAKKNLKDSYDRIAGLEKTIAEMKDMTSRLVENTKKTEKEKYDRQLNEWEARAQKAKAEFDTDALDEAKDKIYELKSNMPKEEKDPPTNQGVDPFVTRFVSENKHIQEDPVLNATFMGHLQVLDIQEPSLSLEEKFMRAKEFVSTNFPEKFKQAYTTNTSLGNSGMQLGQTREKGFEDMPAQDKSLAESQIYSQLDYLKSRGKAFTDKDKAEFVKKQKAEWGKTYWEGMGE